MALGKIKADTLEHSTAGSLDTSYVVNGSAKAWVKFDSDFVADNSLNVSSVTDVAAGTADINYSSNMANANTAVCANALVTSTAASASTSMAYNFATDKHRNLCSSNGTNTDENQRASIVMGDLA
jgi:hypothetical protein